MISYSQVLGQAQETVPGAMHPTLSTTRVSAGDLFLQKFNEDAAIGAGEEKERATEISPWSKAGMELGLKTRSSTSKPARLPSSERNSMVRT